MIMIRHQHVAVYSKPGPFATLGQRVQKDFPIPPIKKYLFLTVPSAHHMIHSARILYSHTSRHVPCLYALLPCVKSFFAHIQGLTPFP